MDLRRLLAVTTAWTALTALVGVLTASAGAGLTCEARWPLCDGAVFGLFPANFMSFVEWSHRLVAMIAGFLIVAAAVAAWRGGHDTRVRLATLGALLLTPVQVVFGAFTVLVHEFVFGYSIVVLTLHFTLAALILGLLVAATVWTHAETAPITPRAVRLAGAVALLAAPVLVALTPRLFVTFGEVVQFVYYGVGFTAFAALAVVGLSGRELGDRTIAVVGAVGAVLVVTQLVVARRAFGSDGQLLVLGLTVAAFGLALAAVWRARGLEPARATGAPVAD